MPNIWFTADLHLNHKRAHILMHRPFDSVEAMNEEIIARYNERVRNGDTVYILGDFAFGEHTPFLQRLKGQKHLIKGNHDHSKLIKKATGWQSVNDMLHLKMPDETLIVLCHYAMRVWRNSHYGSLHFYGHSHGSLPGDSQSCDVGVDCWDYRPVSLDEIRLLRLAVNTPRAHPDHHKTPSLKEANFAEIEKRVIVGDPARLQAYIAGKPKREPPTIFDLYDHDCIPGN